MDPVLAVAPAGAVELASETAMEMEMAMAMVPDLVKAQALETVTAGDKVGETVSILEMATATAMASLEVKGEED